MISQQEIQDAWNTGLSVPDMAYKLLQAAQASLAENLKNSNGTSFPDQTVELFIAMACLLNRYFTNDQAEIILRTYYAGHYTSIPNVGLYIQPWSASEINELMSMNLVYPYDMHSIQITGNGFNMVQQILGLQPFALLKTEK